MAKEPTKQEAPVKEAPVSPTIPLQGKSTTLPDGTVRTDH